MQAIKNLFTKMTPFETKLKFRLNHDGMSLAEVVAASAVSSIIALGSAALIAQSKSISNFGEFQASMDATHSLNVQKVKNIRVLLQAVNLWGVVNSPSDSCFKKKGTGCAGYAVAESPETPVPNTIDIDNINGLSSDQLISMSTTYSVDCTGTKCTKIVVNVKTQPSAAAVARGLNGKTRFTVITIPSSFLVDKKSVEFVCSDRDVGAGQALTGVDYGDLEGKCNGYVATSMNCSDGNEPIRSYGGDTPQCYQKADSTPCNFGVKTVGPFGTQATCN